MFYATAQREFDLADLLSAASKAQSAKAHVPAGAIEPTAYIPLPAAVSSVLGLEAPLLNDVLDATDESATFAPLGAAGGETLTLSSAVSRCSRIAQAGAQLLVKRIEAKAYAATAAAPIIMHPRPFAFTTVEAALFSTMLDGTQDSAVGAGLDGTTNEPLSPVTLPANIAAWTFDSASAAPTVGVQIAIPRSMQRDYGRERVAAWAMASMVLGLGRAIDKAFLSALVSVIPVGQAFSLGGAASAGLKFDELRALIGTAGAGGAVDLAGMLRVAGVPAELTGDMAGTIIGAFTRGAVAIDQDLPLFVERRDTAGNLTLTAYATMQPLIPDPSKFWTVTA